MIDFSFPNESKEYRKARNGLLEDEMALRSRIEEVANKRRALPEGGELKEDYTFEEYVGGQVVKARFSELFQPHTDTLVLYSFMYGPDMKKPCPGCTDVVDALDAHANHIQQCVSIAAVAKNPIGLFHAHAHTRGWQNIRLLSSENNSYNQDYYGEVDGSQIPVANVFRRDTGKILHFWCTEMVGRSSPDGQDPRHVDMFRPLWNVLDVTPGGRGDFNTQLSYART